MNFVDLHSHTTYSDGTFSVKELITLAKEKGITTLAITDHDNISALKEASSYALSNDINLITGVELSASYNNSEVHILAYNFDIDNPLLNEFLLSAKNARIKRNDIIFEKLSDIGIVLDKSKLMAHKDSVITRADFASEICALGFCDSSNEAFFKYLAKNKIAYVDKVMYDKDYILKLIKDIGGLSSLAHPTAYSFYNNGLKSAIKDFKRNGLDAIECYHSSYNTDATNTLISYANRLNLLKTCGSDFHGDKKTDVFLGQTTNGAFITYDMVSDFLDKIN